MCSMNELVQQWKLVENCDGARKLHKKVELTAEDDDSELAQQREVLKIKCEIRTGGFKDKQELEVGWTE